MPSRIKLRPVEPPQSGIDTPTLFITEEGALNIHMPDGSIRAVGSGDAPTGDGASGEASPHTHDYAEPDHTHPEPDLSGYAAADHAHESGTSEHADDYSPTGHDHSDAYAGIGHTHDTTHSHTAPDVGAAETAHTHDTTHDHSGEYAEPHGHPYAATEHSHDYASSEHAHDTSHSHDLSAYATDADLTAHAATPHGGSGGESHTHTTGAAIPNATSQGNTSTQIANNRTTINLVLEALRDRGIIAR